MCPSRLYRLPRPCVEGQVVWFAHCKRGVGIFESRVVPTATHFFGALAVVTYNHWRTATAASCMTVMGSTLLKNSLIPGWERSSIRKLNVGIGQSGRGGVGGGGGMGRRKSFDRMKKSCDT